MLKLINNYKQLNRSFGTLALSQKQNELVSDLFNGILNNKRSDLAKAITLGTFKLTFKSNIM